MCCALQTNANTEALTGKHRMHKSPAAMTETMTSDWYVYIARNINNTRQAALETQSRHIYAECVYQGYYFLQPELQASTKLFLLSQCHRS